jgi:hypothetical protein
MCHLRGLIHLHLNAIDRAKMCFMEAVSLDVKCYESFDVLVGGNMMALDEGKWQVSSRLSRHVVERQACDRMEFCTDPCVHGTDTR